MALIKWDPFADLNDLHNQLNTVFNQALGQPSHGLQMAPVTDIYTQDNTMVIEAHLPNFAEEDVHVSVNRGMLEIRAAHTEKDQDTSKRAYMIRESSSSFYRAIALPEQANEDDITASFNDGLLKVIVPYKALPQAKKIEIQAGSSGKKQVSPKTGKTKK